MIQQERQHKSKRYYPIHQSGKLKHMKSNSPENDSILIALQKTRSLYS